MEPPSPQNQELLLTKLARLRLKVEDQTRESAAWVAQDSILHRQAAWFLQRDREALAELELLVWLAFREKETREALEAAAVAVCELAFRDLNPLHVPPPAQITPKPDA